MHAKYTLGVITVLILVSVTVMIIENNEKAYGQNATTTETATGQMANLTNATGVSSGTGEYDDRGEVEEGSGEDQDDPGDVDTGDEED
jgi:hypothetical protein